MKRSIAALSVGVLALGLVVGGAALGASAHTSTFKGTGVCQADGTQKITWSGSTISVPDADPANPTTDGHTATLTATSPQGGTITPVTQQVVGNTDYSFTQIVAGDVKGVSAQADLLWTDGHHETPTADLRLAGNCIPQDAAAAVPVSNPTCQAAGVATFTGQNVTVPALDQTPGAHSVVVTATDGHLFSNGTNSLTVNYTVGAQVNDLSCYPPQACIVVGSPYTEDTAPTVTADGDLYPGGGGPVEKIWPVTGNLQGFTSQSVTFTDVHGYQPSVTLVFNPNGAIPVAQGGSGNVLHYANLASEWYQNGGAPDTAGTFTATQTTLWWTNKIANGDPANPFPGSQANPQPLSFFENLLPANAFTPATFAGGVSAHLGGANPVTTHSVVTALAGCVTANTVPVQPDSIPSQTVVTTDPVCDVTGGGTTTTTTTNFVQVWQFNPATGKYDILGDKTQVGESVVVTNVIGTDVCPIHITTAVVFPTQTDLCGVTEDARQDAVSTDAYTITTTVNADGSADYSAAANEGYTFEEGAVLTAHLDALTDVACPLGLPPTTVDKLVTTGTDSLPWLVVALGLGSIGFIMFKMRRKQQRV